jgi:hypothetical protein
MHDVRFFVAREHHTLQTMLLISEGDGYLREAGNSFLAAGASRRGVVESQRKAVVWMRFRSKFDPFRVIIAAQRRRLVMRPCITMEHLTEIV